MSKHTEELEQLLRSIIMATVEDLLIGLGTKIDALTTAVAAIPTTAVAAPAPVIDFTPVINAINASTAAISAQIEPSPAAASAGTASGTTSAS